MNKTKRIKYSLGLIVLVLAVTMIGRTNSNYYSEANIGMPAAVPVISLEGSSDEKTLEFNEYGWAVYRFDVVNGKIGDDGLFYVNEVDMEFYVNPIEEVTDLSLEPYNLYPIKADGQLEETPIPFVEGKGYGPIDLPYKVDDQTVQNEQGYMESKYIKRQQFALVYKYEECEVGSQSCEIKANEAGKKYNVRLEVKAYQKT